MEQDITGNGALNDSLDEDIYANYLLAKEANNNNNNNGGNSGNIGNGIDGGKGN